jgi:hypothetical protein
MPCSPLEDSRRFGGTYRLHLQSRKIRRARRQRETKWQAEGSAESPAATKFMLHQIYI